MYKILWAFACLPFVSLGQQQTSSATLHSNKLQATAPKTISSSSNTNQTSNTTNSNTYPMTVSSGNASHHSPVGSSPELTVEQIDQTIAAIQQKIQYVSADSTMKAKAEANGWFDDMNHTISELEQKKQNLTNN